MQCTSYRRQDDEIRGRHLVAARTIKKGELIFCERPLCSLQSLENVHQGALACRCCRAFCGGPSLCLKLASGSLERENIFNDSNLIPCRQKCGEVFCSKECEQDFWLCHEHLCTGPIDDENHPLLQWKRHAIENNEIFLLVGDVVASIVAHPDLMDTFHDFSMIPWWNVATLSFANSSDSTEALELSSQCKNLCEESSKLLNDVLKLKGVERDFVTPLFIGQVIGAFEQNSMGIRARHPLCRDILSMKALRYHQHDDVVSCLGKAGFLGCDDDDMSLEEETATETSMSGMQVAPIDECDTSERKDSYAMSPDDVAEILASLNIDEHSGEDDLDAIFSPLDGTAMYNLICKMNHSCCPNVVVVYRSLEWGEPLVAQCIAQHDIDEGEELCISYIDANQPFSVRSFELLNYGFACNCTKCFSDRAALQALEPQESDFDTNVLTEILDLSQETNNPPSETLSGEEALQLKFDEILKVSDSSDYASIPMAIYSETHSLISKLTSDILPSLDPESDVAVSLVNCLAATNLRYFSECFEIGTRFVNQLLENSEDCFSEKLHHMIWVGSLTAAMGMAHFGSFLKALEMLDKAMIFKFNRMEIPYFVSYVELHANEASGGPLVARNVVFHSPSPIEPPIFMRSMPRLIPEITEHHLPDGLLETANVIVVRELAKDWIATSKWR
jgi:SET domain